MLGVVKLIPVAKGVPTVVLLLYHCTVCPVEQVAPNVTVPVKHTLPGVVCPLAGAGKFGFTVATTEVLLPAEVSQLVAVVLQPTK